MILLAAMPVFADKADVIDVKVTRSGSNSYDFSVTIRHNDSGWKHYADRWDVIGPDGKVLGSRTLYHPHVNEQPFTRSLSGVIIPSNIESVTVQAHCSVHGINDRKFIVKLPDN
jgi:hypothetical protein